MDIDSSEEIWAYFETVINKTIAGIGDVDAEKNIAGFYPNPAKTHIMIKNPGISTFEYSMSTIRGKIIHIGNSNENVFQLDLSTYKEGVYVIKIQNKAYKLIVSN